MTAEGWDSAQQREKARGALRGLYLGEAERLGRRRADALRQAEEQLDKLARLLPNAAAAGIGLTELARVAGVSRPTLYQLKARYSDDPGDVRLAVLQCTLQGGTAEEIAEQVRRPAKEVEGLLWEFESEGWVAWDIQSHDDGDDQTWHLLLSGLEALERWTFEPQGPQAESADGG